MIVGIAFIVMMLFLVATGNEISKTTDERAKTLLKDVMFRTQNEINLASEALSGYERVFTNPTELNGQSYNISNSLTELVGQVSEFEFILIRSVCS